MRKRFGMCSFISILVISTFPLGALSKVAIAAVQEIENRKAMPWIALLLLDDNQNISKDDFATTAPGTEVTIDVLANDEDRDGDALKVSNFTQAKNGTVVENVDSTFTYTPETDFIGIDTFTYTITDKQGETDMATVTIGIYYNFVVTITDDQRWDTLWAMPIMQDKLANQGVRFNNAFISTPLCAPSRASLLAGGFYAHNTGVVLNTSPNGAVQKFHDTETLATLLQNAGYKTALIGKYLNEYPVTVAPYVPPGWTKFVTLYSRTPTWFDWKFVVGSSGMEPTQGQIVGPINQYITDYFKLHALNFLNRYGDSPFFLLFSTNAAHYPAVPASGDENLFSNYVYRDRAYGEVDLSDKPEWVRNKASDHGHDTDSLEEEDEFHRDQLRSLQAVDRAVGEIIDKVREIGKLNQTIFIFTSDHGFMWGEHGLFHKGKPYEESIRVPFVVKMPGIAPRTDDHLVAVDLDIGPTLFDLAGLTIETDGLSLIPLLENPDAPWRNELLTQNFDGGHPGGSAWAGLRTKQGVEEWKYVEYTTGGIELYDLLNDPYEEESKHSDPGYQDIRAELASRLAELKGLNLISHSPPKGRIGEQYSFQLQAWGGEEPYTWSIVNGQLPEGLFLESFTGLITGVPIWAEGQKVTIKLEDSSIAKHTGMPQSFIKDYKFIIK
jgi:arylsulfatase A-like enzyme